MVLTHNEWHRDASKDCLAGYENLSFTKSGGWDAFKEMVEENEGKDCWAFMNKWPPSYLPEAWTVSHCQKCPFCVVWIQGDFVFKTFISLCYVPCTVLVAGVILMKKK